MSKHLISTGLAVAVVALAVSAAVAADDASKRRRHHVRASLDGYQETPFTLSTTGRGKFEAEIDDERMEINYKLIYEDLEGGAATAAHIHLGRPATSGGVSAFLCGGSKPVCQAGVSLSGVIVPSDVIGPTAQGIAPGEFEELVRAIRAGATYANVHTPGRPGGEIRGLIRADDDRDRDRD